MRFEVTVHEGGGSKSTLSTLDFEEAIAWLIQVTSHTDGKPPRGVFMNRVKAEIMQAFAFAFTEGEDLEENEEAKDVMDVVNSWKL